MFEGRVSLLKCFTFLALDFQCLRELLFSFTIHLLDYTASHTLRLFQLEQQEIHSHDSQMNEAVGDVSEIKS